MSDNQPYRYNGEKTYAKNIQQIEDSQELSEERSKLALIRTLLANERSFSAWIRTGISAELGGLGVAKLLTDVSPDWIPRIIGVLFVVLGIGCYAYGLWRYHNRAHLLSDDPGRDLGVWGFWLGTFIFIVSAILAGSLLFT
jgi:putative membrane protein